MGEVAEIVGGGTPDTTNEDYWDGNIDWYSPTEIGKEIYAFASKRRITELGLKESSAKMLPPDNTILFTSRAGIGDMAILKSPAATNQGFQSLVVNDDFDVYFVYSAGGRIKEYALKNSSGSTFLEISGKNLSKMELSIPSHREQTAIGNFFRTLDSAITLHKRKLDGLKNLKKAYLQQMFPQNGESVPRVRFAGFIGDWESKKLGDVGEIVTGSTPPTNDPDNYSENGLPWITPTDIDSILITNTARRLSEKGEKIARVVPPYSILVTCIASIGKNAMTLTWASFNQQINAVVPNDNNHPYFLLTQSELWSAHMKNITASTTMQIVNKTEFSKIVMLFPCKNEQNEIGDFFRNLDTQITIQQTKLDKLKQLKQAYLQRMFI